MAYKIISVKCPECRNTLSIEEGRKQAFCTYCGNKVLISDENEHTIHIRDDAEIQQTEAEHALKLKELEIQCELEKGSRRMRITFVIIWAIITLALILLFVFMSCSRLADIQLMALVMLLVLDIPIIGIGAHFVFKVIPEKENIRIMTQKGGIVFPKGLTPFAVRNYDRVSEVLYSTGFDNIKCVCLHDLNALTAWAQEGKIARITVNGRTISKGGKVYMPDAPIVITYHGR